jgi:hypothetical protein
MCPEMGNIGWMTYCIGNEVHQNEIKVAKFIDDV